MASAEKDNRPPIGFNLNDFNSTLVQNIYFNLQQNKKIIGFALREPDIVMWTVFFFYYVVQI